MDGAPHTLTESMVADLAAAEHELLVFLVRHAEHVGAGNDPKLSAEGHRRADALARLLRGASLAGVHSSPARRALDTAAPTAKAHDRLVTQYPYSRKGVVARTSDLLRSTGRHLVVCHRGATEHMVRELGGDDEGKIAKDEFDRIYIVLKTPDGTTSGMRMRYES